MRAVVIVFLDPESNRKPGMVAAFDDSLVLTAANEARVRALLAEPARATDR